ncbi:MAG: hypothetical protein J0H19_15230, partial [Rhodospirillales bacterium]|nr:hypothetical protein [Rhodospirillales bacterium]
VLATAGMPVAAGGNLGPAALSLPLLPHDGVYVLEMSSYMLERIATMRFDAAAMLNLSADHLDRHGDMTGYARAKRAIFDRQTDADLAVIGVDDALSREMAAALRAGPARVVRVSGVAQAAQSHAGPAMTMAMPTSTPWPASSRTQPDRCSGSPTPRRCRARTTPRTPPPSRPWRCSSASLGPTSRMGSPPIPACRTGSSSSPRSTACASSTTRRRPTPMPPNARWSATTGWSGSPAAWRRRAASPRSSRSFPASPGPC